MVLVPDVSTFKILPPVYDEGARLNARMFVDLYEESSSIHARYDKDSRGIVSRALDELSKFGYTHANWGQR